MSKRLSHGERRRRRNWLPVPRGELLKVGDIYPEAFLRQRWKDGEWEYGSAITLDSGPWITVNQRPVRVERVGRSHIFFSFITLSLEQMAIDMQRNK